MSGAAGAGALERDYRQLADLVHQLLMRLDDSPAVLRLLDALFDLELELLLKEEQLHE